MEKKNTVLLTVIAVATLLVAVVGATFAYFTATTSNNGTGAGEVNLNAAKIADITLTATTIAGSNNVVYPGTMNYVGASVDASVDALEGQESYDYNVSYTLTGKVTLAEAFAHDVTYKLYKTNSSVTNPVTCDTVSSTVDGNTTKYEQTCTTNGLGTALTVTQATGTAGTVAAGTTEVTFTYNDTIATNATNDDYYYLVVEYPNKTEQQDADQGKTIKAEIVSIVANQAATITE